MYTPINGSFGFLDAIVVALVSISIVFLVLAVSISVASIFSKILMNISYRNKINPRIENKLLEEDGDAQVAVIVASIDYYNETKKDARLVSITRSEED